MTIYMVVASNREDGLDYFHWNKKAFSSRKSAEDYIKNLIDERSRDTKRMLEIEDIEHIRKLTDDEYDELLELNSKLYYDYIDYQVVPFDVHE